jgi:succinate-semialdehyde dehydrogenase / glutarate-semialdehyde dehydrogenase
MASSGVDLKLFEKLVNSVALAPGPHAGIEVRAPFTGAVIGTLPAAVQHDMEYAVDRARAAQKAWAALSFRERAAIFLRFHDLLLNRQDEALDLIQLESGKARAHAFEEILDTAIVARYYARRASKFLRPRRRKGALPILTRTWELRVPLGVVGFITPWNFPLTLGITDAIAALLAGNAAIVKPDPQAGFTALWGANLLCEAGLPENVLCIVTGEGEVAGQALVDRADYITFTGSNRIGRIIAAKAGDRLKGCALELGGKNVLLVLADADLQAAADGAVRACFVGAGQVCISTERIYVQESVFRAFLDMLTDRTRKLKLGAAFDYSAEVGSLTTAAQLQKVESHIEDAVSKGAHIVAGGRRRPDLGPFFFEPTILTGVGEGMKLFAEETFGPVVSVYAVAGEKEAIEQANASPYGLSASIWTRDAKKGARIAREIQAGSVNVNEGYSAAWGSIDSPIGGLKESGLHPRHGAEGMLKYTESQTIAMQRWMPIAPAYGMSQAFFARWMTRMLRILRWTPWLG